MSVQWKTRSLPVQNRAKAMITWLHFLLTLTLLTLTLLAYRMYWIVRHTVHIIRRSRSVKIRFKQKMQTMQREVLRVKSNGGVSVWSIAKQSNQTHSYRMKNWTQWMILCRLMWDVFISRLFRKTRVERSFVFPTYGKLLQGSNRSVERGEFCRTSKFNCQYYHERRQYPLYGLTIEQVGYLAYECRDNGTYPWSLLVSYQGSTNIWHNSCTRQLIDNWLPRKYFFISIIFYFYITAASTFRTVLKW